MCWLLAIDHVVGERLRKIMQLSPNQRYGLKASFSTECLIYNGMVFPRISLSGACAYARIGCYNVPGLCEKVLPISLPLPLPTLLPRD
jgi:hypothetical protein